MPEIEELLKNKSGHLKRTQEPDEGTPNDQIWDDLLITITKDSNYKAMKNRNSFTMKDKERVRDCITLKGTKETLRLNAVCYPKWDLY